MARHGASGGAQGGGIEQIAPPTGPFTAFLGLGLFIGAAWVIIKHPTNAAKCLFAGAVLTLVLIASGTTDANPIQHPWIGLLAILLGFSCAPDKSQDHKKGTRK